ncbi:MAG: ATP-binding protein [Candidatus Nanopelagicales bacterium]
MTSLLELELFAPQEAGFRLNRFEVYNWGTFDGQVWSLDLGGRNGLLTGDIGSGKSTLVDGLTTLLVAPSRLSYNKAAGADARERTLTSYVLGHYKSERGESATHGRPVALRGPEHYSTLLAVFTNAALGQTVSLAMFAWHREAGGRPERLYVAADRPMTIATDFAGFSGSVSALRRRLRDSGASVHDTYPPYAADFRRRMGIPSAGAMDLFHQTVSMKSVGNLTDFVRTHMLDPADMSGRIANLIAHVDDLTRAHDAVLAAKAQVAALTPIVADLNAHAEASAAAARTRTLRDTLRGYLDDLRISLLSARIRDQHEELTLKEGRQRDLTTSLSETRADEADLRAAIREQGGGRLAQLEHDLDLHARTRDRKKRDAQQHDQLCQSLDLEFPDSAEALTRLLARLDQVDQQLHDERAALDNDTTETAVALNEVRTRATQLNDELTGLSTRDTNIDGRMIAVREQLCAAAGLAARDLPFVGELLRVTDPTWEPAAERLLHGFGLSLLVADRLYRTVSDWVDRTDLRGRLVYFRVRGATRTPEPADERSLVFKLEVRPEHEFSEWLTGEVNRRFDLVCARTPEEFQESANALTLRGQVKSGGQRHEKDDRFSLGDRGRYVLGWDNRAKRAALAAELVGATARIEGLEQRLDRLRTQRATLDQRLQAIGLLARITDFTDLDWRGEVTRVADIQAQIAELRASSDVLADLHRRLEDRSARVRALEGSLAPVQQRIGALKDRIDQDERTRNELSSTARPEMPPADRERLDVLVSAAAGERGLTLATSESIERQVRDDLQAQADRLDKRVAAAAERAIRAMAGFRSAWPLLTAEMDASVEAGPEYRELLERLRTDDLPRFEADFKEQLNVNAIREVVGFSSALAAAHGEIARRISHINDSLSDIEYQTGTYIQLEVAPTTEPDVREFRNDLRACTEGAVLGSGDDQYSEAKFLEVKRIVSRLAGRPGRAEEDRRWRERVTDVRTWSTFAASERSRADGSVVEHFTDSSGKSGGQKEKLAYTILAASLASQFGLIRGEMHARTFRFVVIDEAFGRGSDESARFALELFARLDLQLLVVTPLQKIHIIEPYVNHVGFVHNEGGHTSKLRNLSIETYRTERAERAEQRMAAQRR